jgi:hypothetical protein
MWLFFALVKEVKSAFVRLNWQKYDINCSPVSRNSEGRTENREYVINCFSFKGLQTYITAYGFTFCCLQNGVSFYRVSTKSYIVGNRYIGRRETVKGAPGSPDLNPMEFTI